jgi:hypothetical protein
MEAICSSETSVLFQRTTRRYTYIFITTAVRTWNPAASYAVIIVFMRVAYKLNCSYVYNWSRKKRNAFYYYGYNIKTNRIFGISLYNKFTSDKTINGTVQHYLFKYLSRRCDPCRTEATLQCSLITAKNTSTFLSRSEAKWCVRRANKYLVLVINPLIIIIIIIWDNKTTDFLELSSFKDWYLLLWKVTEI